MVATDTDNQFAPPMWTDEQAPPSGFGDASMEASPSPMRPTSGSASGPSPVDTPSPAKSAADEGFGMMHRPEPVEPSPQGPPPSGKQQFHDTMADFGHAAEKNRAALMALDPADPQFREKMADLQLQHGTITTEKARYQILHPWGGPESEHPGVLGRIGHVAGTIGNVVGDAVLGKGNMAEIPGSEANLQAKAAGGEAEGERAVGQEQKAAQAAHTEAEIPAVEAGTEHTKQETENLKNPQLKTLQDQIAAATARAQKEGRDPSTDQDVQQLSDVITGLQRQPNTQEMNLDKQYNDAVAKGDHDSAKRILGEMHDMAVAKQAPQRPPQTMVVLPGGQTEVAKPGMTLPEGTQNVGGFATMGRPTVQQRNVAGQAASVVQAIPDTIAEIKRLGDQLGPVAGRWNEFMQGKVGMDNPEFAGLQADLVMLSSAVALAHARGRLPENLRQEFDNMIHAPKQTPGNLVAVLEHINPYMQRMMQMGQPASGGGTTSTPNAAPKQSFADWKKSQAPSVGGP